MKRTKNKKNIKQPIPDERWWKKRAWAAKECGHYRADKNFIDQNELWQAACEYFEWVEDNPLYATHTFKIRNEVVQNEVPYDRPFTHYGLFIYLGISSMAWGQLRKDEELKDTVNIIDQIITTQKYEGAVAGIFNPMIIARDLGLKDSNEISGPDNGPIETDNTERRKDNEPDVSEFTDDTLRELVSKFDNKQQN